MARFLIDNSTHEIDLKGMFSFGPKEKLSQRNTDPCYDQKWYKSGFKVFDLFTKKEFNLLHDGVSKCVCKIGGSQYPLKEYHKHIKDEDSHLKIVTHTRDLFPRDFNFEVNSIIKKLGNLLGFPLTDIDPDTGKKLHIIVRINRPNSLDYNPPHKDIYQQYDETGVIPKCINFWIPICGVTPKSMLPLAPFSHLITEDKILRTLDGGTMGSNNYRVRSVLYWDGSNKLVRPKIHDGQVLVFSSHLIHGCAINNQEDTTRVALEFRLFKS